MIADAPRHFWTKATIAPSGDSLGSVRSRPDDSSSIGTCTGPTINPVAFAGTDAAQFSHHDERRCPDDSEHSDLHSERHDVRRRRGMPRPGAVDPLTTRRHPSPPNLCGPKSARAAAHIPSPQPESEDPCTAPTSTPKTNWPRSASVTLASVPTSHAHGHSARHAGDIDSDRDTLTRETREHLNTNTTGDVHATWTISRPNDGGTRCAWHISYLCQVHELGAVRSRR
jgi:hypothetical protein